MFSLTLRRLPKQRLIKTTKFKARMCCFSDSASNIVKSEDTDIEIPNVPVSDYIFDSFKHPHKIAVECALTGRNYTFEEVRKKAINLGHNLRAVLKLNKGDVVAILLPNLPEFPIALLGVMHVSLMLTTINPLSTPEEIRRQLSNCGAKAVITTCALYQLAFASLPSAHDTHIFTIKSEYFDVTPVGSINFHEFTDSKINVTFKNDSLSTDNALLLYSSGTTGLPKGLVHTHSSLLANTLQLTAPGSKLLETTTDSHQDVVPAIVQLSHMYGITVVLLNSLLHMSKIVTMSKFKPSSFINLLEKYNPTVLVTVPPILLFMYEHELVKPNHFGSLRTVLTAASALSKHLQNSFLLKANKPIQFSGAYGTSECGITLLNKNVVETPESVGKILVNASLKVAPVDDLSQALPAHSRGHLLIKGPHLMKGYYDSQESRSNAFTSDGWLKTGDLVYYDDNKNIFLVDRLKELIKVKGYQVAPAELEAVLRSYPNVEEAAVIGIPHNKYGEVPRAYITLKSRSAMNVQAIEDYVSEKLASYKSIKGGIVIMDNLPKNAYGKFLRNELKMQYSREMQTAS